MSTFNSGMSGTYSVNDERDCENYRCHPNWNGSYESIGCHYGGLQQSLLYHVVLTTEADMDGGVKTFAYKVPETWMDQSLQYFLYPPPGFNVHGSKPWNWGEISFKKRRFPDETFVEYDVVDVLTETGPVPYSEALTQMEVAKVQVEGDEEHKSSKKRPASHSLSDDEGVPGISQLVNLSGDDLSGSSYSAFSKKNGNGSSVNESGKPSLPPKISKVKVAKRNPDIKEKNSVDTSQKYPMTGSFDDGTHLVTLTSSPLIPTKKGVEMNNAQPEGETVEYVSDYQKKVLGVLEDILVAIRDMRNEGLTYESVMKDNMDHFKKVLDSQLKLPIQNPEDLSVLNAALADIELSVCLCCVQMQNLRTLGSKDKIAKAVVLAIFSRSVCAKVQWKKRGKDLRTPFGHLINLVAVLGVVINNVLLMCKRPQLSVTAIVCAVQYARRYHGYEYAKSVTASACSAPTVEEVDEEDEFITKADKEKNMAIDERMLELNKAIVEYKPKYSSFSIGGKK